MIKLRTNFLVGNNVVCTVDRRCNSFGLIPERQLITVQGAKLRCATVGQFNNLRGEISRAGSTICPMRAVDGMHAEGLTVFLHDIDFCIGVSCKSIHGNHNGHAELREISQVPAKIFQTALQGLDILLTQLPLSHTTVHFQCPDRRHQHHRIRMKARLTALDVEEFLSAQIRTESSLGDNVVRQLKCGSRRHHRITTMCDVREWTTVHQGGVVLECLHKIRLQGISEQCRHRAMSVQLAHRDRLVFACVAQHNVGQSLFEILQVRRKTEDRHDLGGYGYIEPSLTNDAVVVSAKPRRDGSQRTIVHVYNAPPGNSARVDVEFVIPMHVVVDQCSKQIVRRADGMKIARKMQIDVGHWYNLRVATARRTTLHAKARAKTGFAQTDHSAFADPVQTVTESDCRRGLTLTGRCRRDRRDEDEFAVTVLAVGLNEFGADFRLVVAIGNQRLRRDT